MEACTHAAAFGREEQGAATAGRSLARGKGSAKSKGSMAAVIPLATQQNLLLQRNLFYTGITRGKKLVVVVGQRKALAIAVKNNKTEERFSGLLARLRGDKRIHEHTDVVLSPRQAVEPNATHE